MKLRSAGAVLTALLLCARAALADPVETSFAVTINPLDGQHTVNGGRSDAVSFAPLPLAELIVRERVIWIQRERSSKFALRAFPIEFVEEFEYGQGGVSFGGIGVQLDCLLRRRLCLGLRFCGGEDSFVVTGPKIGV